MPSFQHGKVWNTSLLRLSVDQHMAGSAGALAAAVLYGGKLQNIPKIRQELPVFFSSWHSLPFT